MLSFWVLLFARKIGIVYFAEKSEESIANPDDADYQGYKDNALPLSNTAYEEIRKKLKAANGQTRYPPSPV
nr:hypothetical protein [Prevotella sp.]